jgi:colanic acid biosynthesis glycosyl transferase WcaI
MPAVDKTLRILIVTQYFWPENFRINDLVLGLKKRGHDIEVLTGMPNYPGGKVFPGYSVFSNLTDEYHGVPVFRCPLLPRGSGGSIRLALNYASFALSASIVSLWKCRGKFDVIFVYEPSPITVALPAIFVKKRFGAPLMLWVQDLWPESLSATGAVTSPTILSVVGQVVRYIYGWCDSILVQSRAFIAPIVDMGSTEDRIYYFPNSAEDCRDTQSSVPSDGSDEMRLPSGFRVVFAGNIGAAQDFETILAAAELLKGYRDIMWVVAGDGRMRSWVEAQVTERGLKETFHLIGMFPVEAMSTLFGHADVLLATLGKAPIFSMTIPSKIQSYLAAAKPVIAAMDGEGARIVADAGAGFTCPSGDSEQLANAVIKLYNLPQQERSFFGQQGRRYFEQNFERNMLVERLERWMQDLAGAKENS